MNDSIAFPLDTDTLNFTASGGSLIQRSILPSGVRLVTEKVPGARSASIGYWIPFGSRDEGEASRLNSGDHLATFGSTHFLEHLLFKGTTKRSALDIAVAFDSVGGEHNALTAQEHTCYYAKVQDHDLELAVNILSDMVTSSLIRQEHFESERGVILEELSQSNDDPDSLSSEAFYEGVFGQHPLARPIGGTAETIQSATRDAVFASYVRSYIASHLVVTAAGSLDHDTLVSQLTSSLSGGGWDMGAQAQTHARRDTVLHDLSPSPQLCVVRKPLEQVQVTLGGLALNASSSQRFTMTVLNAILGGGMSSRLFQEIREKRGLAYSVYSYASGYSDAGLFEMSAGCSPKNLDQVVKLMRDELQKLAETGVTDDEMSRVRGQISGASALSLESSDTRMSRLGRAEIATGHFYDLEASLKQIVAVSKADVQALAAQLCQSLSTMSLVGDRDRDSLMETFRYATGTN